MLQIEGLVAHQGDFEISADLTVESGARVAVIGPSGGGKSPPMGAVCGFVPIARGRVLLEGQDITSQPPDSLDHHRQDTKKEQYLLPLPEAT